MYVVVCVLIALTLSLLLSGFFGMLQNEIEDKYRNLYGDDIGKTAALVADGVVLQEQAIWYYTENIFDNFSAEDDVLYSLYGALSFLIVPTTCVICIFLTGILFYTRKLKPPLAVLDAASAKIASGDLDFHLSCQSTNELGRLVNSFEMMRESLYQANRDLWQMMEKRERLNAAFAHDLRTPLTVLRGYCDFLLTYSPQGKVSPEKNEATLSMMSTYLRRLEGYTESMSSMQKLEEIEPSPSRLQFTALCSALESMATLLAGEKALVFRSEGNGPLSVDSALIFQVCENLIANAMRYAVKQITMQCRYVGHTLTITIKDDGTGFTPDALRKATDPYFRDKKDLTDATHFGLGLYTCQLLCEKHGGGLLLANDAGGKVTAIFKNQYSSQS